jgi:hypothetical protein
VARYIFRVEHLTTVAVTGIVAAVRHLGRAASVLRQPAVRPARPDANGAGGSRRYTFQAFVTVPAASHDAGASLPGPNWHGVVRAGTGAGRSGGLFSALVSGWEPHDGDRAGSSHAVATIIVVGPEPADCLAAGEPFVLWRGREVGHGVVTRRIFV